MGQLYAKGCAVRLNRENGETRRWRDLINLDVFLLKLFGHSTDYWVLPKVFFFQTTDRLTSGYCHLVTFFISDSLLRPLFALHPISNLQFIIFSKHYLELSYGLRSGAWRNVARA